MVTTRVGILNDGTVVTVAPGGSLELALPENPSTGYRWTLGPLPDGVELVDERVERGEPELAAGAAAVHVFAVAVGRAGTIVAQLRREWEVHPAQTFSVQVRPI
jgi:predicted secreted protein